MLEERDHGRGHRHHLARRDVHVVHLVDDDLVGLAVALADQDPVLGELPVVVQLGVGLGDDEAVLLVGGQVVDLVGHPAVDDLAVRRLDEAERVHPGEARQRADQADVRALRGLDRAHPAVVAGVHVADLHPGAVTGQTARTERVQPPLVGQPGDRVGLVHELGQLRGAEELLQRRHHRADVDQGLRCDRLDVLGRHPIPDHPLHPAEAGAQLVLDQLAHGPQSAVAEVVDVVLFDDQLTARGGQRLPALVQRDDEADGRDDVLDRQDLLVERLLQPELFVDLVATDLRQVVPLRVEVVVLQQRLRGLAGRRLTRPELPVDVEQRLVGGGGVVLLQGEPHRLVVAELLQDLGVVPAERLEQHGHVLLALAVQPDPDHVPLVDLELQPRAAARDHLAGEDVLVGGLVGGLLEVDTGAADQLRSRRPARCR